MYIHVTPQFNAGYADVMPRIIDVSIPELDLTLTGDIDVIARHPYPNKTYFVVCRKKATKAIDGLIINTGFLFLDKLTLISRWRLSKDAIVTHRVNITMGECPASIHSEDVLISDSILMGLDLYPQHWKAATCQPCMVLIPEDRLSERDSDITNVRFNEKSNSLIKERIENYIIPATTLEELFSSPFSGRAPSPKDAFLCGSVNPV